MREKIIQNKEAVLIAVLTAAGILVVLCLFYPPVDENSALSIWSTVVSLIVAGVISSLIFHSQKKNEEARDNILRGIEGIIDYQNQTRLSYIIGPRAIIDHYLSQLKDRLDVIQDQTGINDLSEFISEKRRNIEMESDLITGLEHSDLPTRIHQVLDLCDRIIKKKYPDQRNDIDAERKIARSLIDQSMKVPVNSQLFEGIKPSSVFDNQKETIIVVGSKLDTQNPSRYKVPKDDYEVAVQLKNKKLTSSAIKTDGKHSNVIDPNGNSVPGIDDKERKTKNLILIGGTSINNLTRELNSKLPIQYVSKVESAFLYSWISHTPYPTKCAVIEAIKNDDKSDKIMLVIFGLDRDSTKGAVEAVIKEAEKSSMDEYVQNKTRPFYPAKVILQVDSRFEVSKAD